jgi:hypothetical protein
MKRSKAILQTQRTSPGGVRHRIRSPSNITTLKGSSIPRRIDATPSGSNESVGCGDPWAASAFSGLAHGYP